MPSKKTVWETLSAIDCDGHTEEKNGFTYLSWSWAWQTLKENYPQARFEKGPVQYLEDGTALISVRVFIGIDEDVTEVFPVINYSNKPIPNPNAFQINTAYQRCLVKVLAYMGLGMYIYHGDDNHPDSSPDAQSKPAGKPAKKAEEKPVAPSPNRAIVAPDGKSEDITDGTWKTVAEVLIKFMDGRDINSLRQFWSMNQQAIEHLEQCDPEEYKRVYDAFMDKANKLKENK